MLNGSDARSLLRIARNALSVLTSDVLNRATTFLVYALVSRYLDARAFGQLSLALVLFYMFQVFAALGLPVLLTREVAKNRAATRIYLAHAVLLALGGSLASLAVMTLAVRVLGYEPDTATVILVVALGLVPYALSAIGEAIFRGWERMDCIAYANVPVSLAKVVLAYLLLEGGAGLLEIAWLLAASPLAVLAMQGLIAGFFALVAFRVRGVRDAEHDAYRAAHEGRVSVARLFRAALPFLGFEGLIAVGASLNVVLLSKMMDVTAVASFNAASQLLVPLAMFSQSVTTCVFPMLCRKLDALQPGQATGAASPQQVADRLIEALLMVTIPGALALFCLAEPILVLAYGNKDLVQAAVLLRIMVASVVLRALTAALGNVLLAALKERVTLRIVAVDLAAGLVFGYVLIGQFGAIGAAVAMLATRLVDFVQHYAPARRIIPQVAIGRLAWPATAASLVMGAVLWAMRGWGLAFTLCAGGGAYLLGLAVLLPLAHARQAPPRPVVEFPPL